MGTTIVILGASYAGLPLAHHLLKHTSPLVPGLKVILVSPNSSFYWNFAIVRGILPDTFSDDKVFYPIEKTFTKYPSEHFEFVVGKAESLDPSRSSVTVLTSAGRARNISYDTLVIATGTSFRGGLPFKNLSSTEETQASLHSWQEKIRAAKSIIVAGAGATGVELSGELGQQYAITGKKQITLITNESLPLYERLNRDVRETAKKQLEQLKVRFLGNSKVVSAKEATNGQATIEISLPAGKTQTLTADLFIPTYGVTPNSSFLPADMVDARGFVKQTTYLQAERHKNIFVLGDVGNLQAEQVKNADDQVQHLAKSLQAQLTGGAALEYKVDDKVLLGVTVGPKGGTGQMGSWKIWSWMIWYLKARYIGTDYAGEVANGSRTVQAKTWA